MGLREQFLKAADLQRGTVDVPEWGGHVTVREMTGPERDAFQLEAIEADGAGGLRVVPKQDNARVVCMCVIDPDSGNALFTEDDLPAVRRKSGQVLERIAGRVLELSGLKGDSKKNSETTPPSSDGISSPGTSEKPTPTT